MTTIDNLKACPFCGGKQKDILSLEFEAHIHCMRCGAMIRCRSNADGKPIDSCALRWNTRTPPERESGDVLEALRQAEYVLEHLQPLIKAAGVPPMARKIGVMSGIATSGAHKIKRVLPLLKAAIAGKELPEEEKCGCDGDGLKFNPVTNGWLVCPCKRNSIEGGGS